MASRPNADDPVVPYGQYSVPPAEVMVNFSVGQVIEFLVFPLQQQQQQKINRKKIVWENKAI